MSITFFHYRFTPKILSTIVMSLVIAGCIALGFWQLERAHTKESILNKFHTQHLQNFISVKKLVPAQFQPIKVSGNFLDYNFFLDNQFHDHKVGYNVISAFKTTDNRVIFIDRGWVIDASQRQKIPKIITPARNLILRGYTYYPTKMLALGNILEKKAAKFAIIEKIDINLMREILQISAYPFIMRLDKHEAFGFIRNWKLVSMPPKRHYAYAVQWFALAFSAFILYIWWNSRKFYET